MFVFPWTARNSVVRSHFGGMPGEWATRKNTRWDHSNLPGKDMQALVAEGVLTELNTRYHLTAGTLPPELELLRVQVQLGNNV